MSTCSFLTYKTNNKLISLTKYNRVLSLSYALLPEINAPAFKGKYSSWTGIMIIYCTPVFTYYNLLDTIKSSQPCKHCTRGKSILDDRFTNTHNYGRTGLMPLKPHATLNQVSPNYIVFLPNSWFNLCRELIYASRKR